VRTIALAVALLLGSAAPAEASGWLHGYASWFGPGLYGHRTACGQKLTRFLKGVAHRTLPCGTLVEVRWYRHHAIVPVVDRGPWGVPWHLDLTARTMCWQLTGSHPRDCSSRWIDWRVIR
jgi:rare lipoprotein A (peptidoglycan hydrolase)